MNRINIEYLGGTNDSGDVQITLSGRRWADTGSFVGETHVERVAIDVAMHSDSANAHLLTRPDNATGNFAAVGNQYFSELSCARTHDFRDPKFNVQCPPP